MIDLSERVRRGREAVAKAQAEGRDVSEWVEHLRRLEAQLAIRELWPFLPEPLRRLREGQVMALVNFSIMVAWDRALRALEEDMAPRQQKGGRAS